MNGYEREVCREMNENVEPEWHPGERPERMTGPFFCSLRTRVNQGDEMANSLLWDWWVAIAKRVALYAVYARRVHDREDLQQEVNLSLSRSLSNYDLSLGEPYPYFAAATRFQAISWLRRMGRLKRRELLLHDDAMRNIPDTQPVEMQLRDGSETRSSETETLIAHVLNKETKLTRKIFRMRLNGRSYEEIGNALGVTQGNARVLFYRLKLRIKTAVLSSDN